jgi:uncharacterized protein YeaO (DUF488 family)
LEAHAGLVAELRGRSASGVVTLVFSAKDPARNNAAVLKEYLEKR